MEKYKVKMKATFYYEMEVEAEDKYAAEETAELEAPSVYSGDWDYEGIECWETEQV